MEWQPYLKPSKLYLKTTELIGAYKLMVTIQFTETTPAPPVQTATTAPHVPRQIPQVKPDSKPAKREEPLEMLDIKSLSAENREEKINETLKRWSDWMGHNI